jgi:hypothetical protein
MRESETRYSTLALRTNYPLTKDPLFLVNSASEQSGVLRWTLEGWGHQTRMVGL